MDRKENRKIPFDRRPTQPSEFLLLHQGRQSPCSSCLSSDSASSDLDERFYELQPPAFIFEDICDKMVDIYPKNGDNISKEIPSRKICSNNSASVVSKEKETAKARNFIEVSSLIQTSESELKTDTIKQQNRTKTESSEYIGENFEHYSFKSLSDSFKNKTLHECTSDDAVIFENSTNQTGINKHTYHFEEERKTSCDQAILTVTPDKIIADISPKETPNRTICSNNSASVVSKKKKNKAKARNSKDLNKSNIKVGSSIQASIAKLKADKVNQQNRTESESSECRGEDFQQYSFKSHFDSLKNTTLHECTSDHVRSFENSTHRTSIDEHSHHFEERRKKSYAQAVLTVSPDKVLANISLKEIPSLLNCSNNPASVVACKKKRRKAIKLINLEKNHINVCNFKHTSESKRAANQQNKTILVDQSSTNDKFSEHTAKDFKEFRFKNLLELFENKSSPHFTTNVEGNFKEARRKSYAEAVLTVTPEKVKDTVKIQNTRQSKTNMQYRSSRCKD